MEDDHVYRVPVKGLLQDDKGRVLVIWSTNNGWELPGGGIDYGEEAPEALRRELVEELGVEPDSVDEAPCLALTYLAKTGVRAGKWRLWLVYKARVDTDKIIISDDIEAEDWKFTALSDLNQDDIKMNERKLFAKLMELGY